MTYLPCSKTTAAPAERGERRERPERPATKAGRTRRVGTKWRTPQGLRPAGRASEENDAPTARPEAHTIARKRDDDQVGESRPRVSDRNGVSRRDGAPARWSKAE